MKKRTLVLLLCLAMVSILAVDGTFAQQASGLFKSLTGWLGDTLGIPSADPAQLDVEIITGTSGILTPAHYEGAFTWQKAGNAVVHKNTCVKNVQTETAFVRLCIAVKTADCLQMQLQSVPADYAMATQSIRIAGEPFTLYTFDYTKALAMNEETPQILMDFALVKETTNEDLAALGNDFVQIQSYAVQASAFQQLDEYGNKIPENDTDTPSMSPGTALNSALGPIDRFNPFQ